VAIFFATLRISVRSSSGMSVRYAPWCFGIMSECPRERGPTSRKARVLADSKSLKEGISPVVLIDCISFL
jgi:hypothetical protein